MNKVIVNLNTNLESIKKVQDDLEYWSAREQMPLLGYKEWRKFEGVIDKAIDSYKTSGRKL
ncbi:MAG: hypothetical protein FD143_2392 [Ignavibacteria bacterium]|nr:MAG: hypothetical protein FD143_2392 [Ignavibacteria bacterium]KAF0157447.1 MAG: hypothetical protein FD188_2740 [Ignavibacteria bacterium]